MKRNVLQTDRIGWLSAIIALQLVLAASLAADERSPKTPTQHQLGQWVRDLGANRFVQREVAARNLLTSGDRAVELLTAAARSPDREVRDRARQIIDLLQKRRRDKTLAEFRKSPRGAQQEVVPGWSEFSQVYGDDSLARTLYAEMLEAEWSLMSQVYAADSATRSDVIARRYIQIPRAGNTYYLRTRRGTVLTLFVIAAKFPNEFAEHEDLLRFANLPEMQRILLEGPAARSGDRRLIRNIVGNWLLAASGTHLDEHHCLYRTVLYRLHDVGQEIGRRVLQQPKSSPVSKDMAMQAIVLRNDIQQASLIEPYLNDTTALRKDQRHRQLRDVALACLMKLHGHDLALIGVRAGRASTYPAFEYGSIGFATEAEREQAINTYRRLQDEKKSKAKQQPGS